MNKYIIKSVAVALAGFAMTSCNDYLDTMPDNRATLDSENKIKSMLVSAYVDHECAWVNELSSDNADDNDSDYSDRWQEDSFNWKDESETANESLRRYWENSYSAIASANQSLLAIDELGGPDESQMLSELSGEAHLCRAYNHFMLANLFCAPWTVDAEKNLGLPYMKEPETHLIVEYERGTLAELYASIEEDLLEGLSRVGDSYYDVPKYHFNQKAAYAFATRFYLYTEQWEKAIDYATRCIGSDPRTLLRDWNEFRTLPSDQDVRATYYNSASRSCNLLIQTAYSRLGRAYGGTYTYSRYCHSTHSADFEDISAVNIFGPLSAQTYAKYTNAGRQRLVFFKCSREFEYTDPVAGTGYVHTVIPNFTTDEVLLNRAEALIMLKRYDEAAHDLDMWQKNLVGNTGNPATLTPESITTFYNSKEYCYSDEDQLKSTLKKHLNPAFTIDAEGSTQECMLQCMLAFRRLETMHHGLRWFDIRRYGIEIPRRVMSQSGVPVRKTDWLSKNDPRRTYQIPARVRDAGFQPNPR